MKKMQEMIDVIDITLDSENLMSFAQKKNQLSWVETIEKVLEDLGGTADIPTITDRVVRLRELTNNSHLRETVRSTLTGNKAHFENQARGIWKLVKHDTKHF